MIYMTLMTQLSGHLPRPSFTLYIFSLVAFVVKRDGLFTRAQNIAVGWGTGISITLIAVSLEWKNYGGKMINNITWQGRVERTLSQYVMCRTRYLLPVTCFYIEGGDKVTTRP